jgi:hypothetical protein
MDIDTLRKLDGKLHSPAAGVVGLSVGSSDLYHFFSQETSDIDDIHNHRRSFTSNVIKGTIRNNIFDIVDDPDSTKCVMKGMCLKFCKATQNMCSRNIPTTRQNVATNIIASFDTTEGQRYFLDYTTFHNLELLTPVVITHVQWGEMKQTEPEFIRDTGNNIYCEHLQNISDNDMWEIIDTTLEYKDEQPC